MCLFENKVPFCAVYCVPTVCPLHNLQIALFLLTVKTILDSQATRQKTGGVLKSLVTPWCSCLQFRLGLFVFVLGAQSPQMRKRFCVAVFTCFRVPISNAKRFRVRFQGVSGKDCANPNG